MRKLDYLFTLITIIVILVTVIYFFRNIDDARLWKTGNSLVEMNQLAVSYSSGGEKEDLNSRFHQIILKNNGVKNLVVKDGFIFNPLGGKMVAQNIDGSNFSISVGGIKTEQNCIDFIKRQIKLGVNWSHIGNSTYIEKHKVFELNDGAYGDICHSDFGDIVFYN